MKYNKSPSKFQFDSPKYDRKKPKTKSCLLLRKNVYSAYETQSFIKDKKNFEKLIKKLKSLKYMNSFFESKNSLQEDQKTTNKKLFSQTF